MHGAHPRVPAPTAADRGGRFARLVDRAVVVAAVALVAVVATFLALYAVHRSARRWAEHSRTVERLAREALTLAVDRETGLRGYLLTRDTVALAPEVAARAPLWARLDSLVALTADNPIQQQRARAIRSALAAWEGEFARPVLDGTSPPGVLAGKPAFDAVRQRFGAFAAAETSLYESRVARADRAQRWALLALIVEIGSILGALLLLRGRLVGQARALSSKQEQLEEQATELEQQTEEAQSLARDLEAANTALVESEESARLLIASVRDYAIFRLDASGHVMSWNPGGERIKGYRPEEIIGRHFSVFYPPASVADGQPGRALRQAAAEGRFEDEEWRLRKDGSKFWAHVVLTPLRSTTGALTGFAKVTHDLTARHHAEEALRESEARFRAFVEAAPQLAWSEHADTAVEFFNARWYEHTGRPAGDTEWGDVVHPEDRQRFEAARAASTAAGAPYDLDVRLRRHDGAYRWFAARVVPLRGPDGRVVAWYGAAVDIDDRHRVEEALTEANRELAATTYTIAHDLRSPLRAIDGFSRILQLDHGDCLPADGRTQLDRIRANSQRMGRLIDGILSLARLGRGDLQAELVDLTAMARAIADDLREGEPERDARLRIAPGLAAHGDPRLLAIVMQNLLGNAWKFTRTNADLGRATEIEVGAQPAGAPHGDAPAAYFVRDNGVGFDPEFTGKLFGTFQRLHHEDEFEGHGIGLATVKRVVERHGGRVWALGEAGRGATFFFTLGDVRPAASGRAAATAGAAARGGTP